MRAPHRACPAPPDLDDPLVAAAVAHAGLHDAQRAVDDARMHDRHTATHREEDHAPERSAAEFDAEDRAWRAGLAARRPAA